MSKKALSPVVAAIILIAVAVVVSIAVAAWMGSLTFFYGSEKEEFNKENLETLGFTPIKAKLVNSANVIFIEKAGTFVHYAETLNVTTVFISYNKAWFTNGGIIYAYEW